MRCVSASGRSPSAPVLRAIRMCRSDNACHPASSQSCTDAMVASQIQRICSVADLSVPKARRGAAKHRHGGLVALGEQRGQGVEQQVGPARRARPGAGAVRAACAMSSALPPGRARRPGEQGRRQRVEVGVPGERRIERAEPARRFQQEERCVAAVRCDERDLRAQQVGTRALEVGEDASLSRGEQIERVIERAGLELRLPRGERALRTPGGLAASAQPHARGTLPRRRIRPAPARGPPTVPAPRQPPHQALPPRAPGAKPGDPDRCLDPSPRRAPGGPRAAP